MEISTRKVYKLIFRKYTKCKFKKEGENVCSYGKILVQLRGEKTQAKVAKDIGIATSTLGMYETEQRIPRDSIKIALAQYYGTTVQNIFFNENCHEKRQAKESNKQEVV